MFFFKFDKNLCQLPAIYQMGDDSHLYRDATEKVVVKSYI